MTQRDLAAKDNSLRALRRQFGAATEPWSGIRHEVTPWGWIGFSGVRQPEYNVVLCDVHDGSEPGYAALQAIKSANIPGMIFLAGEGFAEAQRIVDAGWVCGGAFPFMARSVLASRSRDDVRLLGAGELASAVTVAAAAYGVSTASVAAMLCPSVMNHPNTYVIGHFDGSRLTSCVLGSVANDLVTWTMMATDPKYARRGHAHQLMSSASAVVAAVAPVRQQALMSTRAGYHVYRDLGFEVVEHWQMWSRPRWIVAA